MDLFKKWLVIRTGGDAVAAAKEAYCDSFFVEISIIRWLLLRRKEFWKGSRRADSKEGALVCIHYAEICESQAQVEIAEIKYLN